MLRDVARVQLGAAVDLGAVAVLEASGSLEGGWASVAGPDDPVESAPVVGPRRPPRRPRRRRRRRPRGCSPPGVGCGSPAGSVSSAASAGAAATTFGGGASLRYSTTPSSARARRSSKSRRLDSDSTRIFRFLISMPARVSSTTRLCSTS
ncbi:MAG: hypothetical protein HYS05_08860 [Acidobacteria bacterium]|nr:hypothetical protein [Acidobacteriota bacterium]